jgi:drug/metabolite transporter (DMT)-like permease
MTFRDILDLTLLAAIWGASFLLMRVSAPEFGPVALIAVRVALAALLLLPFLLWRGQGPELLARPGQLVLVGVLNSALPFTLFAFATLSLTAGFVSVLNATMPLFTALVGYFWLRDKLTRGQVVGLVLGAAGVALLSWDRIAAAGASRGAALPALLAICAALVATLSYGVAANFTKRYMTGVAPLVSATGSQVGAALALAPLAVLYWPAAPISLKAWLCVLGLGAVCTAVAYILYFRLLANIGPARAVTVTFLVPVFAVAWGYAVLSEAITLKMLAACGVIVLGTALSTGVLSTNAMAWPKKPGEG